MKTKFWIMIVAALSMGLVISGVVAGMQHRHMKDLRVQVQEQSCVIDSLLKRRMTVFDVRLNVTDKSRFAIYGRYNKGTISVPNERTYTLELDSFNIRTK